MPWMHVLLHLALNLIYVLKKKAITVFIIVRHVKEGFKNFICKHAEQ